VHRTREARSGQIVVARVHDEVTVKRLRRRGNTVELLPENPEFKTIVVDLREDDFAIEGLGVGVIRRPSLTLAFPLAAISWRACFSLSPPCSIAPTSGAATV